MRFSFYGHMMCFLNCHLVAHITNALQRVDEFEYILETQDFDIFDTPHVLDHKSAHLNITIKNNNNNKFTLSCSAPGKKRFYSSLCLTGWCSGLVI